MINQLESITPSRGLISPTRGQKIKKGEALKLS